MNSPQNATLAASFAETFAESQRLHRQARTLFPDGVTHDLRRLEPFPVYVQSASGSHKTTVEGIDLIDYWCGHGALLLGHGHPRIVEAVREQASKSTHPGACHALELEWGTLVKRLIPSAEKLRFVSSGTEATLMALRLARMHTGRPKALKFAGHFHGWHDYVAHAVEDPNQTTAPGVPTEVSHTVVVVPPNDPELVESALVNDPSIGCVILEPTGGHWGQVPIGEAFLRALREITARLERLLIFDEVITGFRVAPGGAQAHFDVTPDLTTLAKVLAGGLPGGCCAGRDDVLAHLERRPDHVKMPHPGTFNANPLSAAAGVAALSLVADGEPTARANELGRLLRRKLNDAFVADRVDWLAYGAFSGFRLLPDYAGPRSDADDFVPFGGEFAQLNRYPPTELTHAFRRAMLLNGVDTFGLAGMLSAVHTEEDVEKTVKAVIRSIEMMRSE